MALMPISVREPGQAAEPATRSAARRSAALRHRRSGRALEGSARCREAAKRGSEALGSDFLKDVLDELPHARGRPLHALRTLSAAQRHGIQRARPGCAAVRRRRAARALLSGQHCHRLRRPQSHRVQLQRRDVDLARSPAATCCRIRPSTSQCLRESFDELVAAVEKLPSASRRLRRAGKRPRMAHKARAASRAVRRKAEAVRAPKPQ